MRNNTDKSPFGKFWIVKIELPDGEVQDIATNGTTAEIAKKHVLDFYNAPERAIKEVTEYIFPTN